MTTFVAVALLLPTTAWAAGGAAALIKDCQDERIDGAYTAAEYRDALRRLPTDVDEYTGCRDTLRSAQLRAAGASTRSAPAGGGTARGPVRPAATSTAATPAAVPPASSTTPPGDASSSGAGAPASSPATPAAAAAAAPSIPGLPAAPPPVGGADPSAAPSVPVSVAASAGEDVPPTLAIALVVLAGALLAMAALVRRRRRA